MLRVGFGIFSDLLPDAIADVVGVNPPYEGGFLELWVGQPLPARFTCIKAFFHTHSWMTCPKSLSLRLSRGATRYPFLGYHRETDSPAIPNFRRMSSIRHHFVKPD